MIKPPDFDDMFKLADTIGELATRVELKDNEIKALEARIVLKATTDPQYFDAKGNAQSMAFINSTYKQYGFDGELFPLRNELAELKGALERAKKLFDVHRDMLSLYQTESANKRYSMV